MLVIFVVLTMFLYCFPQLKTGSIPGLIYRSAILLLFLFFFITASWRKELFLNKTIIIFLIIYITSSIVSISTLYFKTGSQVRPLYIIESLGDIFLNSILVFMIIDFLSINETKSFKFVVYLINGLCLFSIIFSIIKDYDSIIKLFNNYDHSNYDITSIFVDKNTFGLLLFIGTASTANYTIKQNKYFLPVIIIYFLYSILIRAKSASLVIFIIVVFVSITNFKSSLKDNKKRTIIIFFIVLSLIVAFISLVIAKIGWFDKINSALFGDYGIFYDASVVFKDRIENWNFLIMHSQNPLVIFFGWGERFYKIVLNKPIDNAYLCNFLSGGVIKFSLFIIFNFWCFIYGIKNHHKPYCFIIVLTSCLIYGLFQDYYLQGFNFSSLGFLLTMVLSFPEASPK